MNVNWEKLAKERGEDVVALKQQVQDLIETRGDLERQLAAYPIWRKDEPPKGRAIVAIGRIIQHDEISTYADPFVAAIVWMKDDSGYEGWHYCHSVLTVARTLDDEVMVDYWNETPTTANS